MNATQFVRLLLAGSMVFFTALQADAQKIETHSSFEQVVPGTTIKFKMIPLKSGSFTLTNKLPAGSTKMEQKQVSVSSFSIGAYEVTFDEYDAFFKDESYSRNQTTDAVTRPSPPYIDLTLGMGKEGGYPANSMSQYGALMYCRWLYKKTGAFYRLATEAEWEYACRAGSKDSYPFGNDTSLLAKYAWYKSNSEDKYHKIGLKEPNAWGIYDMLGNIAEWTLDQFDENYFSTIGVSPKDPLISPTARHPRTVKGGNYQDMPADMQNSSRLKSNLDWNRRDPQIPRSRWWNADAPFIGFRIVKPDKKPSAVEIEKFFADYLEKF
ncbi:MAG: SUMF1/EgtB/PvdO family nonheme iron enzyme [Chitinophagaceae bacterium]